MSWYRNYLLTTRRQIFILPDLKNGKDEQEIISRLAVEPGHIKTALDLTRKTLEVTADLHKFTANIPQILEQLGYRVMSFEPPKPRKGG
ncbi:hypothetical protein [Zhaonella formicivorans]|uniref:hypothetical protein n=1 Tax=Zhaonella formicivorans TaxID=2528593 RepID=UPI0010ED1644|nr:hypothetical protein [Zhaonella formicivorans]